MTQERKKIFLVDDNETNLATGKNILKDYYKVFTVPSAKTMFVLLNDIQPDLILLDIEMPGMNGYEAIKQLKHVAKWKDIPVIFLTSHVDMDKELEGLSLGAVDYMSKPFPPPLLLKRIENHLDAASQKRQLQEFNKSLGELVAAKTKQVFDLQNAILGTIANLVEFRDDVTGGHIDRTERFIEILVRTALAEGVYVDEMCDWNLDFLIPSAKLHDVGKIGISDVILNKPGKLTPEEFEVMKTHTTIGVAAIRQIQEHLPEHDFLTHASRFAGYHHERWDGTGYPNGLRAEAIPLEGRFMAIVDVYDALISERPYKKPCSAEEAQQIIEAGQGTHFDPCLVYIFTQNADKFAGVTLAAMP
ncbi:MAG: response regulator [Acidobacteriota bacterium]|jgi:putative two-component system response regulator|nr:response regulator [Acidobacteriota bacterium]